MYMLNMVIILIVMYCNVVTAIDKIPTYLLRFNMSLMEGKCKSGVADSLSMVRLQVLHSRFFFSDS